MSENIAKVLPDIFHRALTVLQKYRDDPRGLRGKTRASLQNARQVLLDEDATATAVFLAALRTLGREFLSWEPESVWLELADKDIDLSLENRDKIEAVMTILMREDFRWDAQLFENVVSAFNNVPSTPDTIQEASPAEIAWGAFEAELLSRVTDQRGEYDYEPIRYTALAMHRYGLVVAPELLTFAQEELNKFNHATDAFREDVMRRWNALDKERLEYVKLTEEPEDVQLARLAAIHLYVGERADRLDREVQLF